METVYNGKTENKIIRRLFLKSEVSWGISDFSKAIGPIIDLFFVSRFIGIDGVTVLGYMSPLIMFFELLGSTVANGARNKVSHLIGAGKQQMADKSDVTLGGNRLLIKPQETAGGIKTAMGFLAEHGLKAERMILHDHLPKLNSLSKLTPEQAATFTENMKKCAFWKITLADSAKQLDAADAGSSGFDVSANLVAGTLNMAFTGRLDTITAPNLLAFYEAHKDQVKAVRIDCTNLEYISSAGLRVLLIMQKGCNGGVTLSGINAVVKEILEQTGFDAVVNIEE